MSGRNPSAPPESTWSRAPRVCDETIVAAASASGRGAIAIVRVSGSHAEQICRRVVTPRHGWPVRVRMATRCRIHAPHDATTVLDDGLVTVFPAPRSYTGEHVVELGTHGGAYVAQAVCAALVEAGARTALVRAREELVAFRVAWSTGALPAPVAAVHV